MVRQVHLLSCSCHHPEPGFGQRFDAHVAPGHCPLVVLLGEHGTDQSHDGGTVGEDPDHVCAPADLSVQALLGVVGPDLSPVLTVTKLTLRTLARRALSLEEEVKEIDRLLKTLVAETAPELNAIDGVGIDVASAILVAAGDNPERLKSESTFAKLCGISPLDASSGKQQRHRLNRSGDRQANSALWHIVFTRMVNDPRTKRYIERRMKEGRTKKEAIRCLNRYVAREVFAALPRSQFALDSP